MTITDKLPDHIITLCLNYLSVVDLLNCRRACSSIRVAVDSDVRLRYKIELYANGMINGPPSITLPRARLERLLEHQWRWESLKWTTVKSLPFPTLPGLDGTENNEDAILTRGSILCTFVFLGGYFRFFQVPSRIRGLPFRQWDVGLGRILTLDVDFDPYQDLLIVLGAPDDDREKIQLTIHCLTDGIAHPLANRPLLTSYNADQTVTTVRIFGPYVTMFMRPHFVLGSRLNIYNWKTGSCVKALWRQSIESITIISERFALMVELPNSNVASCLQLWIVDIHRTESDPFICALLLPNMPQSRPGVSRRAGYYVHVQSGPHSSFSSASPSEGSPLFSVCPGNRLVLVTFSLYGDEAFALFTLASRLVELAEACDSNTGDDPPLVPWEDWGPQNARLVDMPLESGEHICVYGTKAVIAHEDIYVLYNFNQSLIKRELSRSSHGEAPNGIVTKATELVERMSFRETVTTYLPYKSSRITSEGGKLEGKLIHVGEDGIMDIPTTFDQDIQICTI